MGSGHSSAAEKGTEGVNWRGPRELGVVGVRQTGTGRPSRSGQAQQTGTASRPGQAQEAEADRDTHERQTGHSRPSSPGQALQGRQTETGTATCQNHAACPDRSPIVRDRSPSIVRQSFGTIVRIDRPGGGRALQAAEGSNPSWLRTPLSPRRRQPRTAGSRTSGVVRLLPKSSGRRAPSGPAPRRAGPRRS